MSTLTFSSKAVANPHQHLVGLNMKDAASQISALRTAGLTVRTIEPGAMITMDSRLDRVNISINAAGTITGVRMG